MKAIAESSAHLSYSLSIFLMPAFVVYHLVHTKLKTHICAMDITTSDITKTGEGGDWAMEDKENGDSVSQGWTKCFLLQEQSLMLKKISLHIQFTTIS